MKECKLLEKIEEIIEPLYDEAGLKELTYAFDEIINTIDIFKKEQANITVVERVQEEKAELRERFRKLTAFINNKEAFSQIRKKQQYLLKQQSTDMSNYLFTLNERLADFKEQGEK